MEAWIEIGKKIICHAGRIVASFMEAWIEMLLDQPLQDDDYVASFMEAWIEIKMLKEPEKEKRSPPSWRRGLKSNKGDMSAGDLEVASFMEAWIEISSQLTEIPSTYVASFMEAWIEINNV